MSSLSLTSDAERTSVTPSTPARPFIDRVLAESWVGGAKSFRRVYRSDEQRSSSSRTSNAGPSETALLAAFGILLLAIAAFWEKAREAAKDRSTSRSDADSSAVRNALNSAVGALSRLEDADTAARARVVLDQVAEVLPHVPVAVQITPSVVVGDDGAYLLEWTVGRRRVGISIEKNPADSGWYHVSLDPDAPGSGSGSMKDLDLVPLLARLAA
jgi:hypothetical protein